jgi:hypothetical protein
LNDTIKLLNQAVAEGQSHERQRTNTQQLLAEVDKSVIELRITAEQIQESHQSEIESKSAEITNTSRILQDEIDRLKHHLYYARSLRDHLIQFQIGVPIPGEILYISGFPIRRTRL